MRGASILIFPLLLGCPKKPAQVDDDAGPLHPDLVCPDDTIGVGAGPPVGTEVWCHKGLPSGRWVRQGPVIKWHANGQRAWEGEFSDDRRTGAWNFWYPTGIQEKQGSFVNGSEEGLWTTFHPSGDRASEGQMVDGREHGPWSYWSEDGATRTEGAWILGERDGIWLDYGTDNVAVRERVYRTGRLTTQREL